jgi:hypothetical protein
MCKIRTLICILATVPQVVALNVQASLPPLFSVHALGFTSHADASFRGVERDGGGGGSINGKHLIVFSDTATMENRRIIGFSSNSVVFVGQTIFSR